MNEKNQLRETYDAIDSFKEIIDEFSTLSKKNSLDKIVEKSEKILKINPPVITQGAINKYLADRSKVLSQLVKEYFHTAFSTTMPVISSELFELKRYVKIDKKNKTGRIIRDCYVKNSDMNKEEAIEYIKTHDNEGNSNHKVISMPLFAYVSLSKDQKTAQLAKETKVSSSGWSRRTMNITANLPGTIGPKLREKMSEVYSTYHSILSQAYKDETIGTLLMQNKQLLASLKDFEIGAIWIPTQESLDIKYTKQPIKKKQIDPAMVLNVLGNSYLVTTWNVDDEEPFERYLDFYTSKNDKKINSKN